MGDDLADLEAKARAATPGTRSVEKRDHDDGHIEWIVYGNKGDVAVCCEIAQGAAARANAYLTAACSPDVVLALLERLRAAEAIVLLAERALLVPEDAPVTIEVRTALASWRAAGGGT